MLDNEPQRRGGVHIGLTGETDHMISVGFRMASVHRCHGCYREMVRVSKLWRKLQKSHRPGLRKVTLLLFSVPKFLMLEDD